MSASGTGGRHRAKGPIRQWVSRASIDPMRRRSLGWTLAALTCVFVPCAPARAQTADARDVHEIAVHALVRIEEPGVIIGSGWLLAQTSGRPLVITARHVADAAIGSTMTVGFYQGAGRSLVEQEAEVVFRSVTADIAALRLSEDPPSNARALSLAASDPARGERIVVGGHPMGLEFQTTEGTITGALPGTDDTASCGVGRLCLVVDAASFSGSSGGPAINAAGELVGMIWGGPAMLLSTGRGMLPAWVENPAFTYLLHVRVIEDELRAWGERSRERRRDRGED
jgi:hypothetical protein